MKIFHFIRYLSIVYLLLITYTKSYPQENYCAFPPFLSTNVPPNIMIMLSIETPMQGTAHPDVSCSRDDEGNLGCHLQRCVYTNKDIDWVYISNCYDNEKEYYGYFDPNKCYIYDKTSNTFIPESYTDNHICTGKWSGNFLNWATMTAVDSFRKAMTGGNRVVDEKKQTVLLGARQTIPVRVNENGEIIDDWNLWFPIKRIDVAENFTPYSGTIYIIRYSNGFVVCKDKNNDGFPDCVLKEDKSSSNPEEWYPKLLKRGVCSEDPYSLCKRNSDCDGKCLKGGLDSYILKIEVCSEDAGLEENCNTENNKPEGVLQKYADKMRFSLISYAIKNNPDFERDGGIIRANMKWIGPKIPHGLKYHDNDGNLIVCENPDGCDNPEKEIDKNGIFVYNPDKISGGNSGVINYINKFGYSNGYKQYDPVSEMYYEIIRYFKGLSPTKDYCEGLDDIDDGFPVYCNQSSKLSWRDPILYPCQKNFVIAINDAYPWLDKRVPGTQATASVRDDGECVKRLNKNGKLCKDYGGRGKCVKCVNDFGNPSNADTSIDTSQWTDKVGIDEGLTPGNMCIGCVYGGECDWQDTEKYVPQLSKAIGTCYGSKRENSYYIAGLAYYAHNTDLRKDLDGSQNIITYMIDTQETSEKMVTGPLNMLYLAAKYGGFIDINGNGKPDLDEEWDKDGDGQPDTYFLASNPEKIEEGLKKAFKNILKRTASGTAISSFSGRNKKGTMLVQAVFYPEKNTENEKVSWIGNLYSYWFYNTKQAQNIREDTNFNKILDKYDDLILKFGLDNDGSLLIKTYSVDVDGKEDSIEGIYSSLDEIASLWDAGEYLKTISPDQRTIYTVSQDNILINFGPSNLSKFGSLLGNPETFPNCLGDTYSEKQENLIEYVRGYDFDGCRSRYINGGVWKLADIVYSTPIVVNYPEKGYSVVYTGSNGGILHAFKAGYLSKKGLSENQVVKLQNSENDAGTDQLGEELWGFIPKNVLPYLRYLPDPDYCHMYFVDLTPYVFDYKDRKILIGGMRLGGACGCDTSNCVNPPEDTCPKDGECVGLSSYFALDITDPENPKFMWEFTDKDLGFSFSGPGIIKKKNRTYVLFASGPTDYQGNSDQDLKLFIVDLDTGKLLRKISAFKSGGLMFIPESGISNAFGGRLFTQGLDINKDNITDYIALGYSRKNLYYWKGGILFGDVRSENPDNWIFSQYFDGIKPVIAKVEFMTCFSKWYMFFGTGKWFYKTDDSNTNENNYLYGIQINCSNSGCSPQTGLTESSQDLCNGNTLKRSWKVKLEIPDPAEGYYPERMITDPSPTRDNVIAFVTMEPTKDICGFGGRTRVWALNCATGGALSEDCSSYPIKKIDGKILIQLSGGDVREVALKQYMKKDGYKKHTQWMKGVPPYKRGEYIRTESITKIGEFLLWLER